MKTVIIEKLRSNYCARPAGGLGTCGWSPFPWTASFDSNPAKAYESFCKNHVKHGPFKMRIE